MKNSRKRIVSTICLAICLLTASAPAMFSADTAELPDSVIVTPYMVYISNSSCDLSISNGQVSATTLVTGYAGDNKVFCRSGAAGAIRLELEDGSNVEQHKGKLPRVGFRFQSG